MSGIEEPAYIPALRMLLTSSVNGSFHSLPAFPVLFFQ